MTIDEDETPPGPAHFAPKGDPSPLPVRGPNTPSPEAPFRPAAPCRARLLREEQALLGSSDEKRQVTEYRMFARDGRVVWISDEYVLFYSHEGEPLYRGVLLDITERKEIQQAAALQEQRFRSLVQDMSDVIAVFDAGATISYISPSVQRVLGFHPEEANRHE